MRKMNEFVKYWVMVKSVKILENIYIKKETIKKEDMPFIIKVDKKYEIDYKQLGLVYKD